MSQIIESNDQAIQKPNRQTNGTQYTSAEKADIVRELVSGALSIKQASEKYNVWPSTLLRWKKPGRRFKTVGAVIPKRTAESTTLAYANCADRLIANPEHARLVISILLNDSPTRAHAVAKALLVR